MITATSRYANAAVDLVTDDRGTHQSVSIPTPTDKTFSFTYYQVDEGESVDYLAYSFFGDGRLWWVLADANPEILDWSYMPGGLILRVPYV